MSVLPLLQWNTTLLEIHKYYKLNTVIKKKEMRTQIWAVREREMDLGGSEVGVTMIKTYV